MKKNYKPREEEEIRNHREEDQQRPEETILRTSPSQLIDARIAELGDWRGETLARVRALIKQADRDVVET
jgi:hypothetical protein